MDWAKIWALTETRTDVVYHHLPIALLVMLFGGVISSISPSSVPRMVAIVNYAGKEAKTFRGAVVLSAAFVAGICLVYSTLGAVAGSFGALFTMTGVLYYFTA